MHDADFLGGEAKLAALLIPPLTGLLRPRAPPTSATLTNVAGANLFGEDSDGQESEDAAAGEEASGDSRPPAGVICNGSSVVVGVGIGALDFRPRLAILSGGGGGAIGDASRSQSSCPTFVFGSSKALL